MLLIVAFVGNENQAIGRRITLVTFYMESGDDRRAEAVLLEAQALATNTSDIARAELLNAWSAIHLKQARLHEAEAELQEALRLLRPLSRPDLMATVLHNLAAVEMRTGRYPAALDHEQAALNLWLDTRGSAPLLIRGWASLASVQFMSGHPDQARISMDLALAAAEKEYGSSHSLLADLLASDAVILQRLKCGKQAHSALSRAAAIRAANAPILEPETWSVQESTTPADKVYLRSK